MWKCFSFVQKKKSGVPPQMVPIYGGAFETRRVRHTKGSRTFEEHYTVTRPSVQWLRELPMLLEFPRDTPLKISLWEGDAIQECHHMARTSVDRCFPTFLYITVTRDLFYLRVRRMIMRDNFIFVDVIHVITMNNKIMKILWFTESYEYISKEEFALVD